MKLYADDTLIYRPIRPPDDSTSLQEDMNTVEQLALHWQARFNSGKCEHIRITNNKNLILSYYTEHYHSISIQYHIFGSDY